jgi:hypothetical protein
MWSRGKGEMAPLISAARILRELSRFERLAAEEIVVPAVSTQAEQGKTMRRG